MDSFWQWYWWIVAILMLVVVIDVIVDIYRFPKYRGFKDRQSWWWRRLRFIVSLLSVVLGLICWVVTPSRLLNRQTKKMPGEKKKGVVK